MSIPALLASAARAARDMHAEVRDLLAAGSSLGGARRIPYISGLTAVQGVDGERYSYLDLVEFLEESGSAPGEDLPELWRRALFSCAIGNVDNHLRNYGFLHDGRGWRLAPSFDVNPTPGDELKYLNTALDYEATEALPQAAAAVCECFRVSSGEARAACADMTRVLEGWRKTAR